MDHSNDFLPLLEAQSIPDLRKVFQGAAVAALLYSGCVSHAAGGPCSLPASPTLPLK